MQNLHIEIVGMTCEHCVRAVKNRLSATPGVSVRDVKVGSADIQLDESKSTMADVGFKTCRSSRMSGASPTQQNGASTSTYMPIRSAASNSSWHGG